MVFRVIDITGSHRARGQRAVQPVGIKSCKNRFGQQLVAATKGPVYGACRPVRLLGDIAIIIILIGDVTDLIRTIMGADGFDIHPCRTSIAKIGVSFLTTGNSRSFIHLHEALAAVIMQQSCIALRINDLGVG